MTFLLEYILHVYKFSRDVIFAGDRNPGFCGLFSRFICYQPLNSICIVIALKKFKDLIFAADKLSVKTAKIMLLKKLYI